MKLTKRALGIRVLKEDIKNLEWDYNHVRYKPMKRVYLNALELKRLKLQEYEDGK